MSRILFFICFISTLISTGSAQEQIADEQGLPPLIEVPPPLLIQPPTVPENIITPDELLGSPENSTGSLLPTYPFPPENTVETDLTEISDLSETEDLPDISENQEDLDSLTQLPDDLSINPDKPSLFSASLNIRQSYSSNQGISTSRESESFNTTISPTFGYQSAEPGAAIMRLTASYTPQFTTYQQGSFDDTLDHDGSINLQLEGAKTTLSLNGNYSRSSSSNRFAESFTEQDSTSIAFNASRKVSEKTSLFANASYNEQSISTSIFGDTKAFSLNTGGLYKISPLTQIGPSLRYSNSRSPLRGTVETLALLANIDYEYSEKLSLGAAVGIERSERDSSITDPEINPTARFDLTYSINDFWTLSGNMGYSVVPDSRTSQTNNNPNEPFDEIGLGARNDTDPQLNGSIRLSYSFDQTWNASVSVSLRSAPSFNSIEETVEDTSYNLNISRSLGTSSISGFITKSFTEYDSIGPPSRSDQENLSFGLNFTHPSIYRDISLTASTSYQQNTGERDFDQISASISLNYSF